MQFYEAYHYSIWRGVKFCAPSQRWSTESVAQVEGGLMVALNRLCALSVLGFSGAEKVTDVLYSTLGTSLSYGNLCGLPCGPQRWPELPQDCVLQPGLTSSHTRACERVLRRQPGKSSPSRKWPLRTPLCHSGILRSVKGLEQWGLKISPRMSGSWIRNNHNL